MQAKSITTIPEQDARRSLWQVLTRPHPSVTDIEQRRQSRLLAGLIIALFLASLLASVMLTGRASRVTPTVAFVWLSMGFIAVLYVLNRTGHYRVTASIFVVYNFFLIYSMPLVTDELAWFFFSGMVMLVSAMLVSRRFTTFVFLGGIGMQILYMIAHPMSTTMSTFSTTVVFLINAPLVLVFVSHRIGLERERQAELQAANARLRESEASLEERVAERTRDLEVAADVSKQVTTVLDLSKLLDSLVERTRAGFNLYHVSVFLFDAEAEALNYEAGTGDAGKRMKAAGKRFNLHDERGLVPSAARTREYVLVNDVAISTDHAPNADLPLTRAELVLPMIIGGYLIGVLDLQSEHTDAFSSDDLKVLTSLAEQFAVAVQNARHYGEQVEIAEQLRAIDTMKSQFLASMSHELRTPLNAILNFTEFVTLGMLGPVNEKQVDALNKAFDSGKHLLALINDVLDMTKIEAGMLKLFVEENIDIQQEIAPALAAAQTLIGDKPVQLIEDIDSDLPVISGDRRRIRQVLLNLLSNAAKFTEQGTITLSIKKRGEELLFAVIDTGPGIEPEDEQIIFEPFKQTETGIQHAGGTGLGLPISRRLVESHGGRLWLESVVGEGATFFFTLPVHSSALAETLVSIEQG